MQTPHLHAVVAGHGGVAGGHGHGGGRGGVGGEAEVVAESLVADTHCVVHTVPEYAVLPNLMCTVLCQF